MERENERIDEEKRARLLKECKRELISTECSHLRSLQVTVEVYYDSMMVGSQQATLPFSDSEVRAIFSNLLEIIEFHQVIRRNLEPLWEGTEGLFESTLLDSFGTESPFGPLYLKYALGYRNSVQILEKYKSDDQLQNFLKEKQSHPSANGLTLQSLLIGPIKRPLRLAGIISKLKQLSNEDVIQTINTVHNALTAITQQINQIVSPPNSNGWNFCHVQ